ncbi:diguanylate cyclase [Vogesella facilis]|uniref:diguanylate cyclase n=1 Tax=Vogesella facilis TaxID=1655232 RepID=A0ABV7RHM6_9NEIS
MLRARLRAFRHFSEWLLLAGILIAVGGALWWGRYHEHEAVKGREQQRLVAQVKLLDANLYRQLDALRRALGSIRSSIPQWQEEGKLRERAASRLTAFAQTMVGVRGLAIIDKQGIIVASSNPSVVGRDVSARPYFTRGARDDRGELLYVNSPVKNSQNLWLLTLSRKVVDTQGQFAGLVIASLDREEFQILLASSRYSADMTVTLAHGDRVNFMTLPESPHAAPGSQISVGAITRLTASQPFALAEEEREDTTRLVAAYRVQPAGLNMDKPLLLELSRSMAGMYAEWKATTAAWVAGYLVLVLFSVLGLLVVHGRRRELKAIALRNERTLREKNRALEAANQLLEAQRTQLQSMAFMDGLTGIANRRHFDEALSREWQHCRRKQLPLSLLVLDLDHFKQLNDHYGHQAGDTCLQQVAQVLQLELFRAHDLAARYGGEEFVCLLPECELEEARLKAEQIRMAIEACAIPNATANAAGILTASIGVACRIPQPTDNAEALISHADTALYRAKAAGRNCVATAAPFVGKLTP